MVKDTATDHKSISTESSIFLIHNFDKAFRHPVCVLRRYNSGKGRNTAANVFVSFSFTLGVMSIISTIRCMYYIRVYTGPSLLL